MDQMSAEELRRLIAEHQVCYEVWPQYVILGKKRVMAGYDVELCGIPAAAQTSGVIAMQERWATYRDLRRLAQVLLHTIDGAGCSIMTYDGSIRAAARRRFRQEIVLTIHITSQPGGGADSRRTPDDGLEALQRQFGTLGMSRGNWYEEDTEQ
jgi:hypothetical protein